MMEINGNTIILDAGEEVTIKAREKEEVVPTPTPPSDEPDQPDVPDPTPEPDDEMIGFEEMVGKFNEVLVHTGHNEMVAGMQIYEHLKWVYGFARGEMEDTESEFFNEKNYPEVYDYHGYDNSTFKDGYNAMQSWIFAMYLSRICPTWGEWTNTQTELYVLAWNLGGGREIGLYENHTFYADPYSMREAGARICRFCQEEEVTDDMWVAFREELGGQTIPASCWDDLDYITEELRDDSGWRIGYKTKQIGWTVNTALFIPSAPGPRVEGTTVCDQPMPFDEGQPADEFNDEGNYIVDHHINDYMVENYNMMAQTPIEEWNGYSDEKQNRLINAAATNMCTYNYMFSKRTPVRLVLDEEGDLPVVDGYRRFVFERCADSPLALEGVFPDLYGIFRYNVKPANFSLNEQTLCTVLDISDNGRFATQDPNYGRSRPGCACTRDGGEKNPIHGAPENEIYNVSVACLVADTEEQRQKWSQEDGFAADSPRSYVSGHSAQITALALLLGGMNTDKIHDYCRRAHEYSVNRTITRYHWNSDVIYGRLFGSIILPIIQAMDGLQDGFRSIREWMDNPQPEPEPTGDYSARIIIRNQTGAPIQSTGEIRLYVRDHIGIDANLPDHVSTGAAYIFDVGDSVYETILLVHGDDVSPVEFDGEKVNEVRFYDYRHYNNIDAGFYASLDLDDPECCNRIEAGATYVILITNIE